MGCPLAEKLTCRLNLQGGGQDEAPNGLDAAVRADTATVVVS